MRRRSRALEPRAILMTSRWLLLGISNSVVDWEGTRNGRGNRNRLVVVLLLLLVLLLSDREQARVRSVQSSVRSSVQSSNSWGAHSFTFTRTLLFVRFTVRFTVRIRGVPIRLLSHIDSLPPIASETQARSIPTPPHCQRNRTRRNILCFACHRSNPLSELSGSYRPNFARTQDGCPTDNTINFNCNCLSVSSASLMMCVIGSLD